MALRCCGKSIGRKKRPNRCKRCEAIGGQSFGQPFPAMAKESSLHLKTALRGFGGWRIRRNSSNLPDTPVLLSERILAAMATGWSPAAKTSAASTTPFFVHCFGRIARMTACSFIPRRWLSALSPSRFSGVCRPWVYGAYRMKTRVSRQREWLHGQCRNSFSNGRSAALQR